jgi:hypothetical protein
MANPETLAIGASNNPAIMAASGTAASVTLDPKKQYYIQHNGIDESGNEQTESIIMVVNSATATVTVASGEGKFLLKNGGVYVLPLGTYYLTFKATSNDPTFSLSPVNNSHGRY